MQVADGLSEFIGLFHFTAMSSFCVRKGQRKREREREKD